jgi:hypothetical protein
VRSSSLRVIFPVPAAFTLFLVLSVPYVADRGKDVPAKFDLRDHAVLATMLDYVHDTAHVKCAGLTGEQARRAPLPGST